MKNLLNLYSIFAAVLALSLTQAGAQNEVVPLRPDYWSDPEFIKKFTYSYTPNGCKYLSL